MLTNVNTRHKPQATGHKPQATGHTRRHGESEPDSTTKLEEILDWSECSIDRIGSGRLRLYGMVADTYRTEWQCSSCVCVFECAGISINSVSDELDANVWIREACINGVDENWMIFMCKMWLVLRCVVDSVGQLCILLDILSWYHMIYCL